MILRITWITKPFPIEAPLVPDSQIILSSLQYSARLPLLSMMRYISLFSAVNFRSTSNIISAANTVHALPSQPSFSVGDVTEKVEAWYAWKYNFFRTSNLRENLIWHLILRGKLNYGQLNQTVQSSRLCVYLDSSVLLLLFIIIITLFNIMG